ncbi:MAG: RidA family protein, partial [Planctomycetaceae bacterium]|nr:RidA family protein [Planctomycetaceae bacterium]
TLTQLNSERRGLLQIQVFVADLHDVAELNRQWDAWVVPGHAPVRACVQTGLGAGCRVEMVIEAVAGLS